jgi:DNA-binding transcriptional ArsR family regulator
MSDAWNALSDPTRRKILDLLRQNTLTAGEIAEHFHIAKPSISHHLNTLKQAGLVFSERNGQQIMYTINTTVFQDVLAFVAQFTHKGETTDETC